MKKKYGKSISSLWLAALVAALLLMAWGCAGKQHVDPEKKGLEVLLLHTNDMHSYVAGFKKDGSFASSEDGSTGGFGRIAYAIKQAKERQDNVLALDAGDQFQGTLFYTVNKWPMLVELDKYMPLDAMTMGNHEYDEGCDEAAEFTRKLTIPVLAANLKPEGKCGMLKSKTQPYLIKNIRGVPVGIIGLANDEVCEVSHACPDTKFAEAKATLVRLVQELEAKGVHHIIALTHLGLPRDRELAKSVDGVDVIVGGHTHTYLGPGSSKGPYPVVEHSPSGQPVLVVTAKRATQYLGELNIIFDKEGVPLSWNGAAREMTPDNPVDPQIETLVKNYAVPLREFMSRKIGTNAVDLPDGMDACREGECLGGMVLTDAMLEYGRQYGATIALSNGGDVRAPLPKGDITVGDVMTMLPFENKFMVRELSGKKILAALEHGVAGENAHGPALLHVAGLSYEVDPSKPVGSRVQKVLVRTEKGMERLNPAAKYRVVLSSYIAKGGDGFTMLKGKTVSKKKGRDTDVVCTYITRHNPLPRPETGRLVFVK